jgi:L-histidine Nalpha-methyltransferase
MLMTADCSSDGDLLSALRAPALRRANTVLRMPCRSEEISAFASSVVTGLQSSPRRLDCRFLYDAQGSALYEQICRQPEYYLTRTEAAILARHAADICAITGPVTLVELGSGSAIKTGHLLSAYAAEPYWPRYLPIDVSESALQQAGRLISRRHPNVLFTAINGTYEDAFPVFGTVSPTLILFLGSTIGNLDEPAAGRFWQAISTHMVDGDFFLLGVDLVKDRKILEAAYNDAAGVTAAFSRNLFARMNRELGAAVASEKIDHLARYRAAGERIEIHGRFTADQVIRISSPGRSFSIRAGEEILIEISRKFRVEKLIAELAAYGLELREKFTDERGWFALLLLQKKGAFC